MGKYKSKLIKSTVINLIMAVISIICFELTLYITYKAINDGGVITMWDFYPISIFFFVLIGLYCYSQYRTKKIKKSISEYYEIIEGLTDEFDIIFLIDMDENMADLLKAPREMAEMFAKMKVRSASDIREAFFDNFVSLDSKEYALPFLKFATIREELEKKPAYYVTYNIETAKGRKHCEAKLMRMGDFTDKHRFIFASRSLDHQDANEAEFRQHLEDAVSLRTEALQEKNRRLNRLNEDIIAFLGNIVEARDIESGEHVRRVKGFTHIIAEEMMISYPEYGLTPEQVDLITSASALHDLGKISIPDAILLKPGKLTPEEYEAMKAHSARGCEILKMAPLDWSAEYLKTSLDICKYHHEKYDGKGYPEGLKGDEIPISAQIVSIVDCFDALINKRCYKDAYPFDEAFEMILRGECGAFSPKIINCFKKCKEKLRNHADNKDSEYREPVELRDGESDLNGINILLIEDDEISRTVGAEILRNAGAWVTEAASGEEALGIIKSVDDDAFDAILMDLFLPGMSGFETTRLIRNLRIPGMDTIPIIAVSVSHSYVDVEKATESGMNAYLYKPISVSQVSKALMYCMRDQANALQEKLAKSNRVVNRDPLTGVRSVAAYMDKVESLKEKVNRQEAGSFALVECDLNGLKTVNDSFGHDIGDIYLVNSCRTICSVFRHSPVYRVGGDEFVVVLEDRDLENRDKLMEILKKEIDESAGKGDPIHGKVSLAAGMAVYDPETDKTVGDVLKRADTYMYNNKKVMHMTVME